jgi:leader peptidase (prepilin peptidase)/N-methyltransferase
MRVADVDPVLAHGVSVTLGLLLGHASGRVVDRLPSRYGIVHLVRGSARLRRNDALVALTALCSLGIGHVLVSTPDLALAHALFLLMTNAIMVSAILAAAAIDIEHLILPNELTIGAAMLSLVTSPLRAPGAMGSICGAVLGLALSYLPFFLLRRARGHSTMGLGDAKLAITAGAWHGVVGVVFVLFAAGAQSALVALVMRLSGRRYEVPPSVTAELQGLRERARAGDEEAILELAADPVAEDRRDPLGMALPFGPFLALACVEVLFLRRWLLEHVLAWLAR